MKADSTYQPGMGAMTDPASTNISNHFQTQHNINNGTDYSYNIGPTSFGKQNGVARNTTKFSDLKFHNTTIEFNKNATTSITTYPSKASGNVVRKANNSIDLGKTQTINYSSKQPANYGNSTQYVSRALNSSPKGNYMNNTTKLNHTMLNT